MPHPRLLRWLLPLVALGAAGGAMLPGCAASEPVADEAPTASVSQALCGKFTVCDPCYHCPSGGLDCEINMQQIGERCTPDRGDPDSGTCLLGKDLKGKTIAICCAGCENSKGGCSAGTAASSCGVGGDTCKSCVDANPCTVDTCTSTGTCSNVPAAKGATCTDDGNPCTADKCDGSGTCQHTPTTGASCTDGNACTKADACTAAGSCEGTPVVCDDGNPCTKDNCDGTSGACTFVQVDDGTSCGVGSVCSGVSHCTSGVCKASSGGLDCNDDNPCTIDTCASDSCAHGNLSDTGCDDGNACTQGDSCSDGSCKAGSQLECDDGNPCTYDGCDQSAGCVFKPENDGKVCPGGTCQQGACEPSPDGGDRKSVV